VCHAWPGFAGQACVRLPPTDQVHNSRENQHNPCAPRRIFDSTAVAKHIDTSLAKVGPQTACLSRKAGPSMAQTPPNSSAASRTCQTRGVASPRRGAAAQPPRIGGPQLAMHDEGCRSRGTRCPASARVHGSERGHRANRPVLTPSRTSGRPPCPRATVRGRPSCSSVRSVPATCPDSRRRPVPTRGR
jgi:hypothetical protein